jgi:hypothetical protein
MGQRVRRFVLRAVDSPRSARIQGSINLYDTEHLYLVDWSKMTGMSFMASYAAIWDLQRRDGWGDRQAHETIKINQSQHITIEQRAIRN